MWDMTQIIITFQTNTYAHNMPFHSSDCSLNKFDEVIYYNSNFNYVIGVLYESIIKQKNLN